MLLNPSSRIYGCSGEFEDSVLKVAEITGFLNQLRDMGDLVQITRGVYRLAEIETVSNPDFVIVAIRIPISVIRLISALSFHEMTTQIPHEISVAIPKDSKPPVIHYPPMQFHTFSAGSFQAGVECHEIDDVTVKVYSPEKTLADCFDELFQYYAMVRFLYRLSLSCHAQHYILKGALCSELGIRRSSGRLWILVCLVRQGMKRQIAGLFEH